MASNAKNSSTQNSTNTRPCFDRDDQINLVSFIADVFSVGSALAATIAAGLAAYSGWLTYKKGLTECTDTEETSSMSNQFALFGQEPNTGLLTTTAQQARRRQEEQ